MASDFQKLSRSDRRLYGRPKILLCGFAADLHPAVTRILEMAGLDEIDAIWVHREMAGRSLAELIDLPHGSGHAVTSDLPRAVIVSGITEKQLHQFMAVVRASGMQPPLWATLTPHSEKWTVTALLAALAEERERLRNPS